MTNLVELNKYREELGKRPLRRWSLGKCRLAEEVALTRNEVLRQRRKGVVVSVDTIDLVDICRSMKVDPRYGRTKLRRYYKNPRGLPRRIKGWTFARSDEPAIRKMLKGRR